MVHALRIHRDEALVEQEWRCAYCKRPTTAMEATGDHRWPRARGGTADRKNIAAACRPCNLAKGSMSDIEFYRLIDRPHPPRNATISILLIWASRRIWKRAHKACERIIRLAR